MARIVPRALLGRSAYGRGLQSPGRNGIWLPSPRMTTGPGSVEVRSTVGQGTTFVVHLPCAPESARLPAVSLPPSGGEAGARDVG